MKNLEGEYQALVLIQCLKRSLHDFVEFLPEQVVHGNRSLIAQIQHLLVVQIDVVLVWRLDRWGRSVADLLATLQELDHLGVGFVSLTEALDLTTPAGRAMAALLAVFAEFEREILRERTRAGLAHARENGKRLGRPATAAAHTAEIRKLRRVGVSKSEIARRLQIGRTSVRRILG